MYKITSWNPETQSHQATSDETILSALKDIPTEKARKLQGHLEALMQGGCKYSNQDFDILSACNGYLREFSEGK